MSAYDELLRFSERWKHLGHRNTETGALLVGPPSEPGTFDYLIRIKSSLKNNEILELESQLHVPLHSDLREFYRHANGFTCFSIWFCLYGLRKIYRSGTVEQMLDQPYDLVLENQVDPKAHQEELLCISKYSDGSQVYMNLEGQCKAYSPDGELIFEWTNLSEWVSRELARFENYLDKDARCEVGMDNIPPPVKAN